MAAPFGGHPRLIEYLAWCSQQGCTMTSGFKKKGEVVVTFNVVRSDDGKHVVIAGIGNNEFLVPTMVAYLDRRLGLNSPFAKIGDGTIDPLG